MVEREKKGGGGGGVRDEAGVGRGGMASSPTSC